MTKDQVTAEEVTQAILQRIKTGQYRAGDRLPPVRKLAEEIGSNRNTVNKAYQMMYEFGLVDYSDSPRKGYFVKSTGEIGLTAKKELKDYYFQQLIEIVWQAMASGMSAQEMSNLLKNVVSEVYGHGQVRVIFFECNDHDTVEMGQRLVEVLNLPVDYRNINEYHQNPKQILNQFDLIITTYHHLAEITTVIKEHGYDVSKVVAIGTNLEAESMRQIARFPNNRIGIVCTNQTTAHMLKHILYGYHPEWEIEALSMESPEDLQGLVQRSDHLIVTHTCLEEVTHLTKRTPDLVVNFQVDEQSVAFLNKRIQQIRLEKIQAYHSDID